MNYKEANKTPDGKASATSSPLFATSVPSIGKIDLYLYVVFRFDLWAGRWYCTNKYSLISDTG
jgi:hypothetical protein